MGKPTFTDKIKEIDIELAKRKNKWELSGVAWMSFDDVCQIIRIHLSKKWNQWDEARPLLPWVNRIISNQIKNILRNIYYNFAPPCLKCPANNGGNLCELYGIQCVDCPMYKKWSDRKKSAFDIKLPVTMENHIQEVHNMPNDSIDIEKAAEILHKRMKNILKPIEWKVYKSLYIDHKDEEVVAKEMGYKSNEENRKIGYKRISILKKSIMVKVKKVLADEGMGD